jgi:hypothetical protein
MTKKGRLMAAFFSLVMYYCVFEFWGAIVFCFFYNSGVCY